MKNRYNNKNVRNSAEYKQGSFFCLERAAYEKNNIKNMVLNEMEFNICLLIRNKPGNSMRDYWDEG